MKVKNEENMGNIPIVREFRDMFPKETSRYLLRER